MLDIYVIFVLVSFVSSISGVPFSFFFANIKLIVFSFIKLSVTEYAS